MSREGTWGSLAEWLFPKSPTLVLAVIFYIFKSDSHKDALGVEVFLQKVQTAESIDKGSQIDSIFCYGLRASGRINSIGRVITHVGVAILP
jgi:hypothetical protein